MNRTKTDAILEAAQEEHADDPERADVLARARRFKASWIELAEALTEVRKNGRWKQWGHESFEAYAKTELHLRQETVEKLTGSFLFLQKRAPEVLSRDALYTKVPSYQAVDYLRRAESQTSAPDEAVAAIRKRVIEDGAPMLTVAREYGSTVFPISEATKKQRDVAGIKNVAKKLRELLGETSAVSKKIAAEVSSSLDHLLEVLAANEERAA